LTLLAQENLPAPPMRESPPDELMTRHGVYGKSGSTPRRRTWDDRSGERVFAPYLRDLDVPKAAL
jgi:hypothetical protein